MTVPDDTHQVAIQVTQHHSPFICFSLLKAFSGLDLQAGLRFSFPPSVVLMPGNVNLIANDITLGASFIIALSRF